MRRPSFSWNGLIYYGEVFGFLLAWVGGAILLTQLSNPVDEPAGLDQIATAEVTTVE